MKKAVAAGAAVLLVGTAAILAANVVASRREAQLEREWAALDPGPQRMENRFPKSGANEAALELERRAAELGIDLAPADGPGRARPAAEAAAAFQAVSRSNSDYLSRQILAEDDSIDPPPEVSLRFLGQHASDLDALEALAQASEPPRWEIDVSADPATPVPNLIGYLALQRMLLVRALENLRRVGNQEATRDLETSWQLERSLLARPEEIAYLIALAVAKLEAGVLRKAEFPLAPWRPRLDPGEWRRAYKRTKHREAWSFSRRIAPMTWGRIVPIGRFWSNEYSSHLIEALAQVERQNRCAFAPEDGKRIWEKPLGRTNFLGNLSLSNHKESCFRLFRAELELEGTEKILAVKEARRAANGQWPVEVAGLESSVCPGSRWIYGVNPDGSATVSFGSTFTDWPKSSLMRLPLVFTVRRPAIGAGTALTAGAGGA